MIDLEDMPVSFDQSGAVYLINLTTVLQHGNDMSVDDVGYAAIFEGDRSFARFGWSLDLTDMNQDGIEDLIFSAPFRTEDITEELKGGLYKSFFWGGGGGQGGMGRLGCYICSVQSTKLFKSL